MKRTTNMIITAMLAATMTVSAFAAPISEAKVTGITTEPFLYQEVDGYTNNIDFVGSTVAYGSTVLYPLMNEDAKSDRIGSLDGLIYDADAVKSISIRQNWEMGNKYVNGVSIVKKKVTSTSINDKITEMSHSNGQKYFYFIAIDLKDSLSDDVVDVIGTLTLKKTSGGEWAFPDTSAGNNTLSLKVNLEVGYTEEDDNEIRKDYAEYNFGNDREDYITFEASPNSYFIVDTCDQKNLVAKFDTAVNKDIIAKYPKASLNFFNGYGLTFNKIGELTLADTRYNASKGYLYELKNGTLSPVQATYDKYEGAYRLKTRTIGTYVLSDIELDVTPEKEPEKPSVEEEKEPEVTVKPSTPSKPSRPNPPTGAVA